MSQKVVVIDTEGDGLADEATVFHVMGWTYGEVDSNKNLLVDTTHSEHQMKCLLEQWHRDDYKIIIHNAMRHDVALFRRLLRVNLPYGTYVDTLALSWALNHDRQKHGLGSYGDDYGVPKPDVEHWQRQEGQTLAEFQYIMRHRVISDVQINWLLWKDLESTLGELYDIY